MKKKLALLMCTILMMTLVGCGKSNDTPIADGDTTISFEIDAVDSADLLTKVWDSYEEADKFPIGGGDYENMVMDTVGAFDVTRTEDLDSLLGMPAAGAALIDDAASMMHMMNANTFTAGAYHLTDASDQKELADLLKDNILDRQWLCGFPDTLLIASVGDEYVVSAFGNAEIIENFKTKFQETYEVAEVIYEESLTE